MDQPTSSLSRRDLLKLGGTALAVGTTAGRLGSPQPALAQTPKRGGTFRLRSHVAPLHFDPHQTIAFSTMIPLSFAYSRLVKVKGGSAVVPGTQPVENDLAESWERQGDTVYVFKLKKGVQYTLHLSSEDVNHGFSLFPVNLNFQVIPGYDYGLKIVPNKSGDFRIICNEFCGIGHHTMVGKVVVE